MAPAPLTPAEQIYYPSLFAKLQENNVISGGHAFSFLTLSDLPHAVLGEIWAVADVNDRGSLDVAGWTVAMRLIASAQKGGPVDFEAGNKAPSALPRFKGHPPPPSTGLSLSQPALNPPLTKDDIAKFTRHFQLAGPSPTDGRLTADKATAIFLKSKLPSHQLGQIWTLADTHDRGSLDQTDFIVGMHFIQAVMSGKLQEVPQTLPAGLYEAASGGSSLGGGERAMTASPAPISRQVTGQPTTPIARQLTGQPSAPISRQLTGQQPGPQPSYMTPQMTGGSFSAFPSNQQQQSSPFGSSFATTPLPWDVSAAEKEASDKFFDQMDKFGRGVIEGDVAVPFMLESKLPDLELATVWDLAAIRKEGSLTKEEFAVAMYLIKRRVAGQELPASLPLSLIPPSLRGTQGGQPPAPANPQKDLFDAFSDSPPASASASRNYFASSSNPGSNDGFGMTPFGVPATVEEDLLGDDDPFTPAPAAPTPAPQVISRTPSKPPGPPSTIRSPPPPPPPAPTAELTQLRTDHASLSSQVADLQSTGSTLEIQTLETKKELMDLQAKLISLRSTHQSEKGNVDKLQSRVNEQAAELKALQSELISAESELSGLRAHKNELDGQIMGDKEEIRGMKRRLAEVGEETIGLKIQLEKARKEARQQRGLVAITTKQLATSEAEKEKTLAGLAEVEKGVGLEDAGQAEGSPLATFTAIPSSLQTASHVPLPETPQRMLSPALSTTSQKSNNPFDRFVSSPPPPPPPSAPISVPAPVPTSALPAETARSLSPDVTEQAPHTPAEPIKDLAEESPSASPLALAAAGVAAAGTALAGVGAAIFGHHEETPEGEETATQGKEEETSQQTSAFDDTFGDVPSSATAPSAEPSADVAAFDDTFGDVPAPAGLPTATSTGASAFDQGFDNGFEDGFQTAPNSLATFPSTLAGQTGETEAKSPSDIPFDSFESSFGDQFKTVEPATTFSQVDETTTSAYSAAPLEEAQQAAAGGRLDSEDSSDEEGEGPEDLDARKPYRADSPASEREDRDHSGPSSNLTSTASAFGTEDLESIPSASDLSAPTSSGFNPTPTAEQGNRRAAPPPPPRAFAPVPEPESDPFGADPFEAQDTFSSEPFNAETVGFGIRTDHAPVQAYQPTPIITTGIEPSLNAGLAPPLSPGFSKFDDFETGGFVEVPNVQPTTSTQPPSTVYQSTTFDDDFDTFDTDFGHDSRAPGGVPTSSSQAIPSSSSFNQPTANPPQIKSVDFDFDPSFADFDSTFDTFGQAGTAQTVHEPAAPTFSFDDAFGQEPAPARTVSPPVPAQSQNMYSAPPGPPPNQAHRPELPSRKTAAEPDDIPDVKKIVSMGFSRSQALNALEIGNYNLQAAIDHLVSGV